MLLRIALFAMLAIGIAGGGVVAWTLLAPSAAAPVAAAEAPPPAKAAMLVAARSLRAGSLIKPEDFAALETVRADLPSGASLDTPQSRGSLTGSMVRRSLGEGQPILPADVVHPGDHGFLAAVLGPNMRAITVAVDAVSGTAGLIWPGDRVDLILTQSMDDPTLGAGHRVAAETVLSDARVIAVDQQIVQGQSPDGAAANNRTDRTATLEVTAPQAERVLVAGRIGKLSLSVLAADRLPDGGALAASSPASAAAPTLPARSVVAAPASVRPVGAGVTWAGDVSPALGSGAARSTPSKVQVFQGSADSKEFHF
jgi:pilus assembly protein CpaB